MKTIRDILKHKGNKIWTVTPDTTVFEALKLMAEKNIGAVLVMEGDDIAGIMSERDYARKVILEGKSSKDTPVSAIMTERVFTVDVKHTAEECLAMMTDKHIRHLPVFTDNRLVAIISIGDVVNAVLKDREIAIDELEKYITGRR